MSSGARREAPLATRVTEKLVSTTLPARRADSRKGENGVVAVVGGSWLYHGAPVLASLAALRSGVDLVYLAVPRVISTAVRALSPNLIVIPLPDSKLTPGCVNKLLGVLPPVNATVVGPGLGRQKSEGMRRLVRELLIAKVRVLLDADALVSEVVAELKGLPSVVTPHAGEFRRVFGVEAGSGISERSETVKAKARESGTTILLKGRVDVISDGDRVALNETGTAAMTVGGTGDVLSGLVAGIMARGVEPFSAAAAGAYVNGLAGERAASRLGFHIVATDLLEEIPLVMKKFDAQSRP